MYVVPGAVTPWERHRRFVAVDLLALEFEPKQKMQKYPRVRLHIVCFLATVSQYRINYVADYYLEYHSVKSFVGIVSCLDVNITDV